MLAETGHGNRLCLQSVVVPMVVDLAVELQLMLRWQYLEVELHRELRPVVELRRELRLVVELRRELHLVVVLLLL